MNKATVIWSASTTIPAKITYMMNLQGRRTRPCQW